MIAGVPAVVCNAIKQWEDEILCLRELLGALQTLCWDKQCVKGVLQADIIGNLTEYVTVNSQYFDMATSGVLIDVFAVCRLLIKKFLY
jgi:hypothetical protein